jgi:hypothetical protein
MSSPPTLENRLILACARTDPDVPSIEELVARGPEWQEIVRKAQRLGLIPLVHASLRQAAQSGRVPKPVVEHLRHLYHLDAIRSMLLREALGAILLRFAEAGVLVIVLKGTALAALVYPSPTLRPMEGIDLLVQKRDLDTVDELLRTMGYACNAASGSSPDAHHHIRYLGREGFPQIDIHHHILVPCTHADLCIPIEDLWQRSRPARIASVAALVFSHEDLLLHLTFQLSKADRGFVGQVRTLCDIGETCKRFGSEMDWNRLVTQAEAYKMGKYLYYALRLARDLLEADVPSRALADLRATFSQLPLEDKLIGAVTRQAILSEDQPTTLARRLSYGIGVDLLAGRHARDGIIIAYRFLAPSCQAYLRRLVTGSGRRKHLNSFGNWDVFLGDRSEALHSGGSRKPAKVAPRLRVQHAGFTHTLGEVAVTYDQEGAEDGVGSQLLRIYGLYALARALHIKYVHTPLGRIGYQGLLPLLAGRTDPDFAARYNAFFSLPSDRFDLECCERVRVHEVDQATVEHYREHAAGTGRPVLIQGLLPYRYTNEHPEVYQALRAVSPYREYRPAGPVRVCIHLRRGDNSVPHRQDQARWLPNTYYLRVCGQVVEALRQQGAPFIVRLHTEIPPRPYTLHPDTPGLYFRLYQPATLDPAQYALEDFESVPNLETVLNAEAQEVLDDFATADVLILSLSALSYVGGLLNPHGLVVYAPPYHVPLPDWLVAGEHGELDAAQVATRIAEQLRRRGR